MSYKKKHLSYGKYVPAAMLIFTLSANSCKEKTIWSSEKKKEQQGLLDSSAVQAVDKYGNSVELKPVEIQVYEANGELKKDYAVLTRGQNPDLFKQYAIDGLGVRRAFFNDGISELYVLAGKYGEIVDNQGKWIGLVIDVNEKVVPLAAKNVSQYREERYQVLSGSSYVKRNNKQEDVGVYKPEIPADSIKTDTVRQINDSVQKADSIITAIPKLDLQIVDTLSKSVEGR